MYFCSFFHFNYYDEDNNLNQELGCFFEKTSFSRSINENSFSEIASKECASCFYGYTLQSFVLTQYKLHEIDLVDLTTIVSDLTVCLNMLEKKMLEVTKKSLLQRKHQFKKFICIQQLKVEEDNQENIKKMYKCFAGNEEQTKMPKKIDSIGSQRHLKQNEKDKTKKTAITNTTNTLEWENNDGSNFLSIQKDFLY